MGTMEQPSASNNVPFFSRPWRHDAFIVLTAIGLSLIAVWFCYYLLLRPPLVDVDSAQQQDVVKLIYADAYWFHELYMRWTGIDWALTFLATGTAVGAVIKNSYSVKSAAAALSKLDAFLIALAVLTVLATTFDGKLHAAQLAERYRSGDLILQEAKIDYAGSKKQDADRDQLRKRWHEAQDKLESTSLTVQKPASGSQTAPPNTPGSRATAKEADEARAKRAAAAYMGSVRCARLNFV